MAYTFDNSIDISKFIDSANVNSKFVYGTLIVYGDLTIKNSTKNIKCKADRLWVRGKLTIQNCSGEIELPSGEIDANVVEITMTPSVTNYPSRILADSVILTSISGGKSLADCEIYASNLRTDNTDLVVDPDQVYGLIVKTDETGSVSAKIFNRQGQCYWDGVPQHLISLKEYGFLKDIHNLKEVQSFCIEAEILPKSAKLFSYQDAKHAWDNAKNDSKQASVKSTFSSGY